VTLDRLICTKHSSLFPIRDETTDWLRRLSLSRNHGNRPFATQDLPTCTYPFDLSSLIQEHGRQFGLKCGGDRDAFGSAFSKVLGTNHCL